jgi:hypothetical protein
VVRDLLERFVQVFVRADGRLHGKIRELLSNT